MTQKMPQAQLEKLIDLIETLRGENGCPWDRKQTPRSMAVYLVEEVFELVDAIDSGNPEAVCEELGDVLFHIFFISRLYQETGNFDIEAVSGLIGQKMRRRHPHVFGDAKVSTSDEVKVQWHRIKQEEKKTVQGSSALDSVPGNLPALMRAYRISERAVRAGFEWDDISQVIGKAEEEWRELKSELAGGDSGQIDRERVALEFGDVLFTLVNVARFARIHPETALRDSIGKFVNRFHRMEEMVSLQGRPMEDISREEYDRLWEEAKKTEVGKMGSWEDGKGGNSGLVLNSAISDQ